MNTGRNGVGAAGRLLAATVLIGRLFMLSALALGALAVGALAPARAAAPTRPLNLDHYYRLQSVSEQLQLTHSGLSEHSPHFSPDGGTLAFLRDPADSKATAQIWLMNLQGGEARQLSHFEGQISAFAMAPDGKRLVFSAQEPLHAGPEPEQPLPVVVERRQFREDGHSFLGVERTHLTLLELASGQSSALTSGAFNEIQPAWSADSSQIVFLSKRDADLDATNNWDVYVTSVQPGSAARQITKNPGTEGDPTGDWGAHTPQFSPMAGS